MIAHVDPALLADTRLDGLARIELARPAWYSGHIAKVRRLRMHRLLLLREVARDGSASAVWVSSDAICAERSTSWATLLDAQPLPPLAVRSRRRFPCCRTVDPLTADIHFPEDIGVRRNSTRPSSDRVSGPTNPSSTLLGHQPCAFKTPASGIGRESRP